MYESKMHNIEMDSVTHLPVVVGVVVATEMDESNKKDTLNFIYVCVIVMQRL